MRPFEGSRLLLVVSGGIAAYKSAILLRRLSGSGAVVDVLLTSAAQRFVGAATFEALSGRPVHTDLWERPLAHVELGRDSDLVVIAPATANLLARLANGLADDMATSTLLAADCPVLACPAMNQRMWEHPATRENIDRLRARGVHVLGPAHGELAEGEVGHGRMVEPEVVLAHTGRLLERASPLTGRKVVVTAGPTRTPLDPVRFLGNRSSGRMGWALAASAWRRGADVVLIAGPTGREPPHGPRFVEVETSDEMLAALVRELEDAAVLLMAAAVSDFLVEGPSPVKVKKEAVGSWQLPLVRGPDLLEGTREQRRRRGILTLGFALETEDGAENALRKLQSKGMDFVALNEAGRMDRGVEAETNQVTLIDATGTAEELPLLSKQETAERLLDRLEEHLGG